MITYDILNGYSALFNLACSDHDLDRAEQIISSTEFLAKNSGFARNIVDRAEAMNQAFHGQGRCPRRPVLAAGATAAHSFHSSRATRHAQRSGH